MQVRALLAKLQAVFDLPRRLRTAIDQGAIEIAVNSYADAAPLLKRYGHKVGMHRLSAQQSTWAVLTCKASASSRKREPDLGVHHTCTCSATLLICPSGCRVPSGRLRPRLGEWLRS